MTVDKTPMPDVLRHRPAQQALHDEVNVFLLLDDGGAPRRYPLCSLKAGDVLPALVLPALELPALMLPAFAESVFAGLACDLQAVMCGQAALQPLPEAAEVSAACLGSSLAAVGQHVLNATSHGSGLPVLEGQTECLQAATLYQANFACCLQSDDAFVLRVAGQTVKVFPGTGGVCLPENLPFEVMPAANGENADTQTGEGAEGDDAQSDDAQSDDAQSDNAQASGTVSVSVLRAQGRMLSAFAVFGQLALKFRTMQIAQQNVDLEKRLQSLATRAQATYAQSQQNLYTTTGDAALLTLTSGGAADTVGESAADRKAGLQWAFDTLDDFLKVSFRLPADIWESADMSDSAVMDAICTASGLRFREVLLKGEWWNHDNGILLAREEDTGHFCIIKPGLMRGNTVVRQGHARYETLTESVAQNFQPFAFFFYRSFASRPLNVKDVLRHGFAGNGTTLGVIAAVGALSGVLGLVAPRAMAYLVDEVLPAADTPNLWLLSLLLILTGAATTAFGVFASEWIVRMESRVGNAVQAAVWDRVLRLPITFLRQYSTGELAQRIGSINTIRHELSVPVLQAVIGGLFSVFNFFILFSYSWQLALVAATVTFIAVVSTIILGVLKLRVDRQLVHITSGLSNLEFQSLLGVSRVRLSAAEVRFFGRWSRLFAQFRRHTYTGEFLMNVEKLLFGIFPIVSTALYMGVMGSLLREATQAGVPAPVTAGSFVAFTAAYGVFFGGMTHLVETLLGLMRLLPTYQLAKPLLEAVPESSDAAADPGRLKGGISVSQVSFRYGQGPLILDDVSIDIAPGEYVAIVGPSGSGKSTLFRLLMGFEKPLAGRVSYDGKDLSTVNIGMLRRQLGVVLQNGKLMAGDIYTNIVGTTQLTLERAMEAARMVGLDADIEKMPMGMHTVVSDGSSTLSGGQRQRILIARAIVNRPKVLLFDEATSALDNRTQAVVTTSLDRLSSTRIVIAHRLSTVVNADRIIVLAGGRVVQQGKYAQLSQQEGIFREMVLRQAV